MAASEHAKSIVTFPSALEIVVTREYEAPIELVFDVMTQPEHVRQHVAAFGEEVKVCAIDLRVGGDYHIVLLPNGKPECSFRGTYLAIERPNRTVATWKFEGWPDVEAVETLDLHEAHDVTTLSWKMTFNDQAGRDHMTKFDGIEGSLDKVEEHLASLLHR